MDNVEPFWLLQEGRQVREGVEVEASVRHKVSVKLQGNALEGVVGLPCPMSCAAWATLDVFVLEDEVSDPEAQGKSLRRPHSAGQAIQRRSCVTGTCVRLLSARVLPPRRNARQEIPFILKQC